jgi:chromosome segregation ATPase
MSKTTDIEKQNLEAHVELCAERYSQLNEKLDNLDRRLTTVEEHLLVIRDSITNKTGGINKQLITIGTTVLGVLATAVIGLLIHLVNK